MYLKQACVVVMFFFLFFYQAEVYDVNDIVSEYAIGLVDKTKLKIGRVFIDNAHDGVSGHHY